MSNDKMKLRTDQEIEAALAFISSELDSLDGEYDCLVHGYQHRAQSYYRQIEADFGVKFVACGTTGFFRWALARLLGTPALIVIGNAKVLKDVFFRVSAQAFAGLYITRKGAISVDKLAQMPAVDIESTIRGLSSHFLYQVDEDSADSEGRMVVIVSAGSDCPGSLRGADL